MPSAAPHERQALLRTLTSQRENILGALEDLDTDALRRQVLPSRWTCLGLVNHLSLDVERFWFQAVIAGDQRVIDDVLDTADNAWQVGIEISAETVLEGYQRNIVLSDAIIAAGSLDAEPIWWPEGLFGSWRLNNVREIVLHVITETAAHLGHLDAVRELIDGKQRLVITE